MATMRAGVFLSLVLAGTVAGASQQDDSPAPWLVGPPPTLRVAAETIQGTAESVAWIEGGGADLAHDGAEITFAPSRQLAVKDDHPFTIDVSFRASQQSGFATLWMCREGQTVHHSLVVGREPGRISFEVWSWNAERATSRTRIDDGREHRIRAVYLPEQRVLVLEVDGAIEAVAPIRTAFRGTPAPGLRLGNNLNDAVHQPFEGALLRAGFSHSAPDSVVARLRSYEQVQVLAPGEGERQVRAWNDRLRPRRVPDWSAAEHEASVRRVRALVQDALGLWPPPFTGQRLAGRAGPLAGGELAPTDFAELRPALSLDVRSGGSLERDGYRVTRTYWTVFEGHEASGWLYEPRGDERRFGARGPAILCPHGHWKDGARHPTVQARLITLAKQGYVVLAVDSIHVEDTRVALSSVGAMTWSNLRALELLRSRADVDPSRMGCTGASGGGQQTYYLTALDSGLAAAAPAVMVCHLAEILDPDHVHCRCNHTPHLARVVDVPEMSAAFAPRPQFFLSVTGDWTHAFPREGYPDIEALYRELGVRAAVSGEQWDRGHDYDRPMRNAAYAFFERWLGGEEDPSRALEPEDLETEPLDALRALDRDDARHDPSAIVAEFRDRLAVAPPSGDSDPAELRDRLRALLGAGASGSKVQFEDAPAGGPRRGRVRTDGQPDVPILELVGEGSGSVICTSDRGMASTWFERAALVTALRSRFAKVWLADIRYTGELDVGGAFRGLHGRFFGQDEGQVGVLDLRRVVRAIPGTERPALVALGQTGAVAVLAAAVEIRVAAVVAPSLGPTWRESDRSPQLSRILLHGDLPEAVLAADHARFHLGGSPAHASWAAVDPRAGSRLVRTSATPADEELLGVIRGL